MSAADCVVCGRTKGVNGMSRWLALACAFLLGPMARAAAPDLTNWNVPPASVSLDDWTATLGGSASGAGYWADQDGRISRAGTTAYALLKADVARSFDNGWDLGIHAVFVPYHDQLSGDGYGNRVFEKDYLSLQIPVGTLEMGQQDGAAYAMSVTGPRVDDATTIDDANVTFFRNPATGAAFTNVFPVRSAVSARENFGKISYYTPRLFGIRLGASYTPAEAQHGMPFAGQGPQVPNRQTNLLEAAASYNGDVGPASLELYGGAAIGHDAARTPGYANLFDWGFGGEADGDVGNVKLAFGGGFRQSNGYAYDIDESFHAGATHSIHLGTTATTGAWIAGFEFSDALAGREPGLPGLQRLGYAPSLGYVVNSNLQLTLGWQYLRFTRDVGTFYDGRPDVALQAAFLHLMFRV